MDLGYCGKMEVGRGRPEDTNITNIQDKQAKRIKYNVRYTAKGNVDSSKYNSLVTLNKSDPNTSIQKIDKFSQDLVSHSQFSLNT